jgi:phosphate-selective porin OprO/OprP
MKNILSKVAIAALATAATATVAHAQTAPTHSTSWTDTVGEDRFGDARFKVRGRFQYDVYSSDWDTGTADDSARSYVRRAFLGVQGRLTEHWRYKVDFVLTPSATSIGVDDAFLEYVRDDWSIVIGESNITSPLEDRISSLDIPFVERSSIINAFEYGRRAGLGFITGGANWSASAAIQGDSLNNAENYSVD